VPTRASGWVGVKIIIRTATIDHPEAISGCRDGRVGVSKNGDLKYRIRRENASEYLVASENELRETQDW
jgi:hypothetical protein